MKPCPVATCDAPVPNDKVMCAKHWFMVPEALRTELWRAYHQWTAHKEDRQRLERLRKFQQDAIAHVDTVIAARLAARNSG